MLNLMSPTKQVKSMATEKTSRTCRLI